MKAITLRNLPPELARIIRQRAHEQRTSFNKTVISLLKEHLGGQGKEKRQPPYHDLDALSGSWSEDEAVAFEQALARQRAIDAELWK